MKTRYKPNRILKQVMAVLFVVFLCGVVIAEISNNSFGNNGSHSSIGTDTLIKDIVSSILNNNEGMDEENIQLWGDDSQLLQVHVIDVGQADSLLIMTENQVMLIDGGNNEDGDMVEGYLKSQGVEKIDYLIGTHPHEDHIGGLDNIINAFQVEQIYMPRVTASTKTFEEVVDAANRKSLSFTAPLPGQTFELGRATCTVLGPVSSKYKSLNNYSIVIRLQYGDTSFLFTGDAEKISEKEILESGVNLKANVLKVGHHGSSTSSSKEFLEAVAPEYAVISVGVDNDYGHPSGEVLQRLYNIGAEVHRTDTDGNIIIFTDGKNISFTR